MTKNAVPPQKFGGWIRFLRKTVIVSLVLALIYLAAALGLVYWPRGAAFAEPPEMVASSQPEGAGTAPRNGSFLARDGSRLSTHIYGEPNGITTLLLHGVAADKGRMAKTADRLSEITQGEVIALDLRGHGASDGVPSDVDYIGQYEDDLADVMQALRSERPDQRIILAGHSMGGGIITRHAMVKDATAPDGYLLFAPNFGEGPTQRSGDAEPQEPHDKRVHFDLARMIGLLMLNTAGIHAFDQEPILHFNFPPRPLAYSYRAVMSGQPVRPATADVALGQMDAPLLVLVGANDQVFNASAYPEYVTKHSSGEAQIIADADHDGVLYSDIAFDAVRDWFQSEFPASNVGGSDE